MKMVFPLFAFCRRWGFMIPWLIVYGLNIIGYFAASIVIFYLGVGSTKACGVVPLIYACTLVVGHFSVVYFVLEQVGSLKHLFPQNADVLDIKRHKMGMWGGF